MGDASCIYDEAKTVKSALKLLKEFKRKWKKKEPEAVKHFCARFEKTLRYLEFPEKYRKSIYTSNPIESFISQMRSWTQKFRYFYGKANLDMALFTYFYSNFGDFVLEMNSHPSKEKNETPHF